jgi:hypothetical protein
MFSALRVRDTSSFKPVDAGKTLIHRFKNKYVEHVERGKLWLVKIR